MRVRWACLSEHGRRRRGSRDDLASFASLGRVPVSVVRVVGYEPARKAELVALMEVVWGRWWDGAAVDWWVSRNPAGETMVSLAQDDGQLVGAAWMSPYRFQVAGMEMTVPVPLNVATHPDYRGRGIFSRLERENERLAAERYRLALTYPNAESARIFLGRLGWQALRSARLWACPTLRWRFPRAVERTGVFERADEHWRRLAPIYGDGVIRDGAYLAWRFVEAPRNYLLLASAEGLAVVGHTRVRGRDVAYLAELLAEPGAPTRQLLRAALAAAAAPFLLALPPAGRSGDLVRLGFLPTPKRVSVLGKALIKGTAVPERLSVSLGDLDAY